MSKDILYKAKRVDNGEWVCGNGSAVLLEAVNEEKEKILKELK